MQAIFPVSRMEIRAMLSSKRRALLAVAAPFPLTCL